MEDSGSGSGIKKQLSLSQRAFVGVGIATFGGAILLGSLTEIDSLHFCWQELMGLRPAWLVHQVGTDATCWIVWGSESLVVVLAGWALFKLVLPKLVKPLEYLGKFSAGVAAIYVFAKYGIPFLASQGPSIPPRVQRYVLSYGSAVAASGSCATLIALVLHKLKNRFNASFAFVLLLFAFGLHEVSEQTHHQVMSPFSAIDLSLYMMSICIVSMSLLHHLGEIRELKREKACAGIALKLD